MLDVRDLDARDKFALMLLERVDRLTDDLAALQARVSVIDTCPDRVVHMGSLFSKTVEFSVSVEEKNMEEKTEQNCVFDNLYPRVYTIAKAAFFEDFVKVIVTRATDTMFNVSVTMNKPVHIPKAIADVAKALPKEFTIGEFSKSWMTRLNYWTFWGALQRDAKSRDCYAPTSQ